MKHPAVKTRINQFQKQVKGELKVKSLVSWENSATLLAWTATQMSLGAKLKTY